MTFIFLFILFVVTRAGVIAHSEPLQSSECGVKSYRRFAKEIAYDSEHRQPRIIDGDPTHNAEFPWQVSLELLHPSWGFLGHWCGGVLIDKYWVLSAAHCIHNDLFNLPLPLLWTAVLGDHDRNLESGEEQRVPIEQIVMHNHYHNFQNDLVLLKLSQPAEIAVTSNIRRICLPFITVANHNTYSNNKNNNKHHHNHNNNFINDAKHVDANDDVDDDGEEDDNVNVIDNISLGLDNEINNNVLRRLRWSRNSKLKTHKTMNAREIVSASVFGVGADDVDDDDGDLDRVRPQRRHRSQGNRRRNDKYLHSKDFYEDLFENESLSDNDFIDLPYVNCVATGWGKSDIDGDLTDRLLQTHVPIHNNSRCQSAYGDHVKIHKGHLCAGKLNGKGGTCVGDSGGPLQCRLTADGPWILAGITSFGSGCALEGFPDVYTRISYYMKWISKTISQH